jgi:hypothetical protein
VPSGKQKLSRDCCTVMGCLTSSSESQYAVRACLKTTSRSKEPLKASENGARRPTRKRSLLRQRSDETRASSRSLLACRSSHSYVERREGARSRFQLHRRAETSERTASIAENFANKELCYAVDTP